MTDPQTTAGTAGARFRAVPPDHDCSYVAGDVGERPRCRSCAGEKPVPEQWRPIPGYEGRYDVSDQGRVRSLPRVAGNNHFYPGGIRKLGSYPSGYKFVRLARGGEHETLTVHRLVLMAFVRLPREGEVGRHLDDNRLDNRLVNLAWGTVRDNNRDTVRNGNHALSNQTHCKQGHPFSGSNLAFYSFRNERGEPKTRRVCRECHRAADRVILPCSLCGKPFPRNQLGNHKRRERRRLAAQDSAA